MLVSHWSVFPKPTEELFYVLQYQKYLLKSLKRSSSPRKPGNILIKSNFRISDFGENDRHGMKSLSSLTNYPSPGNPDYIYKRHKIFPVVAFTIVLSVTIAIPTSISTSFSISFSIVRWHYGKVLLLLGE